MQKNPVIPYIIIFAIGIGLMFLLSFKGLGDMKEMAKGEEKGTEKTEAVSTKPEDIYKNTCIGCHGDSYQGGMGPSLKGTGLSKDEVKDIIVKGKGSMPPQTALKPEQVEAMADFISNLK